MRAKTKNPLSALMTRCKSSLHRVVGSSRTWLGNHQARIWLAISTATFAVAMILPRGWVRGRGDLIQVNLIDFLLRGVVVPEALFFAALVGSRFVRLKWLPAVGVMAAAAAWYAGVLTSSSWFFFVEHVQGTISTTFVDFLTRDRLVTAVEILAAPLAIFGATFDGPAMIDAATAARAYDAAATVMWRNFVLLSLFAYAVLPRLILLAAALIGRGLTQVTTVVAQQVKPWRPTFARPRDASLEWFDSTGDDRLFVKALILTALRELPEGARTPAISARAEECERDLNDDWRRLLADRPSWHAYLRGLDKEACPKLDVHLFDAARYNFAKPEAPIGELALDPQTLPRILTLLIGDRDAVARSAAALSDVARIEKNLNDDGVRWRKWLYVAGAGAGAAAGAVALAPFLGAAGLCALGGGAIAKGGLGILGGKLVLAAAGGAVGTAAGAAMPLRDDEASQLFVQVVARQIALVLHACVAQPAASAVTAWLMSVVEAARSNGSADVKTAKRALQLLQRRTLS